MIHRCITQLEEKACNTASLCRVLGVSRSGYYAARLRAGQRPRICATSTHLRAAFAASGRSYGSRRLGAALRAQGLQVGRYRVRTLMRLNRLRPVWKRKFIHTTDSHHALPIADNVLNRNFAPAMANAAWVSDITYIRTRSGWLYLAAVMDLFSRKIVGWAMAPSMPAELVCSALQMAIAQRQPPAGLIVHSDRGSQYASEAHRRLLERHGLRASMSRKGNCWDNAPTESFWGHLKVACVLGQRFATREQARTAILNWMAFYNHSRLHSALGYLSPMQYEQRWLAAQRKNAA